MSLLDKPKSIHSRTAGQAMVEFIFIIPVLFVFILAVLEFSTIYVQVQRNASLSREVANAIFRDCATLVSTEINGCMDNIVNQVNAQAGGLLENFNSGGPALRGKIIAKTFLPIKGTTKIQTYESHTAGSNAVVDNFISRFDENTVDKTIVQNQGAVVTGEVFYGYKPLTIIGNLLNTTLPDNFYEATIY